MNPFDEESDDSVVNQNSSQKFDDYDPSLDPFSCEDSRPVLFGNQVKKCSKDLMSPISPTPPRPSSAGGHRDVSNLSSGYDFISRRLSLSSSVLSTINPNLNEQQQQQQYQYSFGDGILQKEGLLCPECMLECRTITELMNHFEHEHRKNNISSMSNFQFQGNTLFTFQLRTHHIKGFLNKFLSKQNSSLNNNTSMQDLNNPDFRPETNEYFSFQSIASSSSSPFYNPTADWKYSMHLGPRRSHFEQYRSIRDSRIERYIFETNKLLIRLDKLLRGYPKNLMDMSARRDHEQSIVEWVDETIVSLCPSCACKFNILTRKRHHCRLCGAVMCSKCSRFISFPFALELINPVGFMNPSDSSSPSSSFATSFPNTHFSHQNADFSLSLTSSKMKLRSLVKTMSSMNTSPLVAVVVQDPENLDKLRICLDCNSLLVVRKEKIIQAHYKAPLVKLYEQLRDCLSQIDRLIPVYFRMANSLNIGETTYQLKDAHELKHNLTKLGEQADMFSRKIESYGTAAINNSDSEIDSGLEYSSKNNSIPSPRQLSIQISIRRSTVQYLRHNLLSLPELPNQERLEQLKRLHSESIEQRIKWEKQMALLEQKKFKQIRETANKQQQRYSEMNDGKITMIEDGFCPQILTNDLCSNMSQEEGIQTILDEPDPMVQQMNIIRSYIRQAKMDHRYEEMRMLEDNLKELEIEYFFSQQQASTFSHSDLHDNSSKDPSEDLEKSYRQQQSQTQGRCKNSSVYSKGDDA